MKQFMIGSVITAGIGALTTLSFLIAIGMDYRQQEDQGVEPGYTPEALVNGFEAGLWIIGIGLKALLVWGIMAIAQRRGGPTSRSAASH